LIKYGLSAVFCFLLDFGMLSLFKSVIFPSDTVNILSLALSTTVLSTFLARCISSPVNYLINRMIVFRSNANKAASFISYILLAGIVILVKMLLMWLLVDILGLFYAIANISVEVVLFISNFIIQKLFIFKSKKRP
ncbi:MAG: GtrA family protein, partial [Clostridia bacterium]|nr:GtrA family protein [Clostridia bacterium]